jgi:CHAT domain-containing protein/tetratricopeptide (TPR) repeat protein
MVNNQCVFFSLRLILSLIFLTILAYNTYSQEPGESISGELLKKANHCFEMRQYDSAVLLYKEFLSGSGLSLNRKDTDNGNQQDKNLEAQVSMQIANIYTLKEEYPSAESWYNIALNLADSWSRLKAEIYQNLGSLFFFKENYEYAILYYQKSWIIYSKEPARNSGRIVDLLTSLGAAYSGNVEYQKSLSCFRKADSILKISKKNDPLRCAALNINIGEILVKLDAPVKALYRYRSACELVSGSSISSTNIRIISNEGMAECYTRLGQMDSAMECLSNCLKLIKSTGTNMKYDSSRIYLFMGDVQARQKEWEKSTKYYYRAFSTLLSDSVDFSVEEANLSRHEPDLLDLYKIYGHMGKSQLQSAIQADFDTVSLSRSFSDFLKALKICDHISKDFGQGTSRMTFHESTKSILAGAIESGFLLKEKKGTMDFDDLFSMADANKNRVLIEDMEENRSMTLSGIPDSILKKIRELKDEIVFYSRKYIKEDFSPGTSPYAGLDKLQNKVIDLKLKLDQLRKKIDRYSPDYPLQTQQERNVYPSCIMKSLRNDEAMLEYLCSDSVIYLLLIRPEGLSVKRVVLPSSFNYSLRECLHQLKGAGIRNFTSLSHTLYNYLIAPVEPLLKNIRRLIIIPDEELSLFPFETLIREDPIEASGKNSTSWHYLLRDFEIIYHFSAESWLKDTANAGLLNTTFRFAGFAPGFRNNADKPVSLNPLPFALKEVTDIAGLFGQVPRHQPVFLDTSATEKNFRLYAPGNTHIHIATHSLISEGDPMNSALVFSKSNYSDGQQDKNDGLLHLDEISNLRLDASLVVLSACATGKGKVTHTEGVLALTRGFYLAGASNVVYSLWSIPDHLTGEFMLNFYRSYFYLRSYSAALREVKLKMISRPETSLPYMWAGIVLLGRR